MDKKKPKKAANPMVGGKMLVGVSKTKPGLGGAGKKPGSKMVKKKKTAY